MRERSHTHTFCIYRVLGGPPGSAILLPVSPFAGLRLPFPARIYLRSVSYEFLRRLYFNLGLCETNPSL